MKQRIGFLAFTIALTCTLLLGSARAASAASFLLRNDGDTTIYSVYVSRSSQNQWGPDILDQDVLRPGQETTIYFPNGTFDTCYWDIAVVYTDGHTAYDWDTNLCDIGTVTSNY